MTGTVWDFPGGIPGLAVAASAGVALIVLSYWFPRRKVAAGWKAALIMLRLGLLGALLYALCNPRIEQVKTVSSGKTYRVAVLTDESGSMRKKGFWNRTRLEDAQKFLLDNPPGTSVKFDYFRFSDSVRAVNGVMDAPGKENAETDFFGTIRKTVPELKAKNYDAAVWLSDGIDTRSIADPESARGLLAGSGMKHFFVPVTAPVYAPPGLSILKIEAPSTIYTGMEGTISILLRAVNTQAKQKAELAVFRNGEELKRFPLAGSGLRRFSVKVPAETEGNEEFRAAIQLAGKTKAEHVWTIRKRTRKNTSRILIYNGALEYGNRFLKNVFRNEPSVKVDVVFAPGVVNDDKSAGIRFEKREELDRYDAVALFNLNRGLISEEMEKVLREYAESGGGVIFITGNPMIAAAFADSPLEKFLPVTFSSRYNVQKRYDVRTAGIVKLITSGRRRPTDFDRPLQRNSEMRYKKHPLRDFILTDIAKESPVFRHPMKNGEVKIIVPRFEDYAPVEKTKPAANVLAYFHDPKDKKRHILMAYQNFGLGRSMILATDPLWRWRLKLPANDPAFDLFWKNLFSWLALGKSGDAGWELSNRALSAGDSAELVFLPGKLMPFAERVEHRLIAPDGSSLPLIPVKKGTRFVVSRKFDTPGKYRILSRYENRDAAAMDFSVGNNPGIRREDAALEPDIPLLEHFATLPNVELLPLAEPVDWKRFFPAESLSFSEKTTTPLWLRPTIFLLIAGLFLLELLLRRKTSGLL